MTDPKDARLAYALLWLRRRQINKAMDKVKQYLDQDPGDRNATKLGEARLGKVGMTEPEVKPVVVDADLLTKYVQDVRPDEIVPTVRTSFQAALLEYLAKTGELLDWDGNEVPGVAFGLSKAPSQTFYPDKDADELLTVADASDLPELADVDLAALLGLARPDGE